MKIVLTFGSIVDVVGQEVAVLLEEALDIVVHLAGVVHDLECGAGALGNHVDVGVERSETVVKLDGERLIGGLRKAALLVEQGKEAGALLEEQVEYDLVVLK